MPPTILKLMGGGVDISLPNVSYCKDVKDVHYTPYNLVRFYVGDITTPQTVKIYTDIRTSIPIQVSEGNKWYTYVLPKDKGLYNIYGNSVKKVVVKADITTSGKTIIPKSVVEASFKGSNTSNVTDMGYMFNDCTNLTSLDLSSFDTSMVTKMTTMFYNCSSLKSLDVSNFVTSKVTKMNGMFRGCIGLKSLDVSNFDTSKVTDMGYMFRDCSGLKSLDLSGWDTSNVTDIGNMFKGCGSLNTITMVRCSPETVGKIKTQLKADGLSEDIVTTE